MKNPLISLIFRQGFVKYVFLKDIKMIFEIADFIDEVYQKNSKSIAMKNYAVCKKFADLGEKIVKYGSVGYVMIATLYTIPALYETIFMGKLTPVLRIYFPFVREDSQTDLAILAAFNYFAFWVALHGIGSFDIFIVFVTVNIPMVSAVIISHFEDLKNALLHRNNTLRMTKYRMRSIILMTLKYNE